MPHLNILSNNVHSAGPKAQSVRLSFWAHTRLQDGIQHLHLHGS